ncbi:MAG: TatD family hydrolase [Kiritimatiellia bacterium]
MYDAHLHLQDERFDTCRDAVLAAAVSAGVTEVCCCGTAPGDWHAVAALAKQHPAPPDLHAPIFTLHSSIFNFHCLPAFGVHPWHAGELAPDWQAQLEEFLVQHPGAPVGEIGLDGLRDIPPRAVQQQVLQVQLDLAAQLHRPVVLHGARAWGELVAMLKPVAPRLPGLVAHAFGGSEDILRAILSLGGYVSFAGSVCNPASRRVHVAVQAVPSERLLIETDAPDMLPVMHRTEDRKRKTGNDGKASTPMIPPQLNHPANLVHVAQAVAKLRGVPTEELAAQTAANARQAYRIV